jgi:hypothetical protein
MRVISPATGAERRGCLLMASLPTRFSVGVVSLSLWVKTLTARQRVLVLVLPPPEPLARLHLLWSMGGILFPTYPPYLESIPLSSTWECARWGTDNPTRGNQIQHCIMCAAEIVLLRNLIFNSKMTVYFGP